MWLATWHQVPSYDDSSKFPGSDCKTIRAGLHYGWRSPPVMNSRGFLNLDWPRATLLSGRGLQHGQESVGGEHWIWMRNWHGCQRGIHFLEGEFLRRSSFLGNLKASNKKLDLWRTPTWIEYFTGFSSPPAYHPLPQITMSWAKALDHMMHFSTIV